MACTLVGALACVWPANAAWAKQPLDLRWEAPAECPDAQNVRHRIRELAQTSPQALSLRAEGRIERIDARYRLVLKIHDGAEVRERTIESASCEDLAGAAAVSLGLLLRAARAEGSPTEGGTGKEPAAGATGERGVGDEATPGASSGEPGSAPATSPSAEPGTNVLPKAPDDPAAQQELLAPQDERADVPKRHWAVLLRAPHAVLSLGPLPKPTLGVGGGIGLRYDEWHAVLSGRIYGAQTVWSSQSPDTGAEIARRALELSVCRQWRAGALAWAPCAALDLEQVSARGFGVGIAEQASSVVVPAFGVLATARLYLAEWFAFTGALSVSAASARPRVVIDGFGQIHQLATLRGGAALGLEWIF